MLAVVPVSASTSTVEFEYDTEGTGPYASLFRALILRILGSTQHLRRVILQVPDHTSYS